MWVPIVSFLTKRHMLSWLFEVLPVLLLTLQSVVALSSRGNVDGRARGIQAGCGQGGWHRLLGAWRVQRWEGIEEFLTPFGIPGWQRAMCVMRTLNNTLFPSHFADPPFFLIAHSRYVILRALAGLRARGRNIC